MDTFSIVVPPDWGEGEGKHGANTFTEKKCGNFNLIIDETPGANPAAADKKPVGNYTKK